jgi:hypothetical protein
MEASGKLQVQVALLATKNPGGLEVLEENKYLFPAGIRTPDPPACSILTILTELSRLCFIYFSLGSRALVGLGLIIEISLSH